MRRAVVISGVVTALALGTLAVARWPSPRVPRFDAVRAGYRSSDVALLDRHGEVLHELRVDPARRRLAWTPLAEVSPALTAAVVASEDRRFYRHRGVDGLALVAAGASQLGGGPRGGSTISMQVATLLGRRTPPRRARSVWWKWRQMRQAWALEARWSKAEILEAYVNLATFRGELHGIGAAASGLFGKAPHGLAEAEAAVLAVLLRGPNAGAEAIARRARALARTQGGGATPEALATAVARVVAAPSASAPRAASAPHAASRLLRSAGAPVRSTLDAGIQRATVEALGRHLAALSAQAVRDGAVLVVENATGEVLAYVGGSGDRASARHVDGIRARRQAGSALKPFLYGLALEQGLVTPATLLEDTPLVVAVTGGLYRPRNYDDEFRGLVTLRTALAASLNVPAVRTLGLVGTDALVHQLRLVGFESLREAGDFYGPALALGSADVSLWELVTAYRALARGGVVGPLVMAAGEARGTERRVYTEATAFLAADILSERESRSATFGLENPLATRFWTAVKTGTSKEMRDNWCVGFSRRYTVGVWVGNFSGAPMQEVSGVTGAAPVWRDVMSWLHRGVPSERPAAPTGVVAARGEWFLAGTEPPGPSGLAGEQPRIVAPVSGTVVALDPDIPPARQRLVFEAWAAGASTRWLVDGEERGSAADLLVWEPVAGRHVVSLVDASERVVDTVTFEVR